MDPLSITASAVAIVGLIDAIVSTCRSYISSFQDAPSDLRAILVKVSSLKGTIETLEFLVNQSADGHHSRTIQDLAKPDGPISSCHQALEQLEGLFPRPTIGSKGSSTGDKRRLTGLSLERLAWPFHKQRAAKYLNQIAQCQEAISLSLATDTAQSVRRIEGRLTLLHEALERMYGWYSGPWILSMCAF